MPVPSPAIAELRRFQPWPYESARGRGGPGGAGPPVLLDRPADAADAADAAHAAARSEWASVAVYAAWAAAAEARAEIVERQRQLFLDIFGKE